MKLDTRLKIKKIKNLPIGIVTDCPKEYRGYYYLAKNGALKFKKTSKKKACEDLTYYINTRSYLFKDNSYIIDPIKISKLI